MRSVRRLTDLLVFVGPSGCGKSTIIQKLQAEFPDIFSFSISHTTREPRRGEVDGRDYHFVSKSKFESLLAEDGFIEYTELQTSAGSGPAAAENHTEARSTVNYYGTSKQALHEVLVKNKVVLMDTDVRGAIHIRRYCDGKLTAVAPHRAAAAEREGGKAAEVLPASLDELPRWDPTDARQGAAQRVTAAEETAAEEDKEGFVACSGGPSWRPLSCKVVFISPPSMEELTQRLRARRSESEETLQRRLALGEQWMAWAAANKAFFDHRIVNDDLNRCYADVRQVVLAEVVSLESAL